MSTDFDRDEPIDRSEVVDAEAEQDVPQAEPEPRGDRLSSSQARPRAAAAVAKDSPVPVAERSEIPDAPEQASGPENERWQRIQAAFVDDPRKSVTEAHQLVGELTQRIVDAFAHEREELEHQWSKGGDVSTEDLRVSLQRYRAFFSRLLPSMEQLTAKTPLAADKPLAAE